MKRTTDSRRARRRLAALAAGISVAATLTPPGVSRAQNDDGRETAPTHYTRTIGPVSVDGREYTVKLSVICYKETQHAGMCNEDDEETVKSVRIEDERGKTAFHKSFAVAFSHRVERHVVEVARLEGREHQAIELIYERLPSSVNGGVSIQIFAARDGRLEAMNATPLEFYGQLGEMPEGSEKGSRRLGPGDTLPIYVLTSYFYIVQPVRLDWKNFRLEPQESGEFEVAQQPPFQRKPDIEGDGYIHLYPAPDKGAKAAGIDVTPRSRVEVLRARFAEAPPESHSSGNEVWLKIRIDGREGWIIGADEYTAIGLSFLQ